MEVTARTEQAGTYATPGLGVLSRLTSPRVLLGIEGAAFLALSTLLYELNGEGWLLFALLLLAPDLSMLGYLAGPRVGAVAYNAFHSYTVPAALGVFGLLVAGPLVAAVALVWLAHIGMDRMVGYGLKYPSGPKDTHLGRL